MSEILTRIRDLLTSRRIRFREVHHAPTYTSEESAAARGEALRIGGKALLLKGDDAFLLFVVPADCRVDSAAVRRTLGLKKLRFASRDELADLTGLVPGSVPPFGPPILPFPLHADSGLRENGRIAFNAGSLTDSIILDVEDWFCVAAPAVEFPFAVREPGGEGK